MHALQSVTLWNRNSRSWLTEQSRKVRKRVQLYKHECTVGDAACMGWGSMSKVMVISEEMRVGV